MLLRGDNPNKRPPGAPQPDSNCRKFPLNCLWFIPISHRRTGCLLNDTWSPGTSSCWGMNALSMMSACQVFHQGSIIYQFLMDLAQRSGLWSHLYHNSLRRVILLCLNLKIKHEFPKSWLPMSPTSSVGDIGNRCCLFDFITANVCSHGNTGIRFVRENFEIWTFWSFYITWWFLISCEFPPTGNHIRVTVWAEENNKNKVITLLLVHTVTAGR